MPGGTPLLPPQAPSSVSISERSEPPYFPSTLIARQNASSLLRAPSGPPSIQPSASTTAFIAPALVPDSASMASRPSSRIASRTPQVKAPCAPPP